MENSLLAWMGTAWGLLGTWYINDKKTKGMYFWIISNAIWIYFASCLQLNYPLVAQYIVFTVTNVIGIYKWKRSANA